MRKFFIITGFLLGFILIFNNAAESQLKTVVSVTGSVFNSNTKDPIRIDYQLIDATGKVFRRGKTNAAQNGYYFVTGLKPGETYKIVFEDEANYFKAEFPILIPNTDKYEEFSRDFLVVPKYKGVEIAQKVPVFEANKSKLRGGADFFMEDFISTLRGNPNIKFTVVSYPDNDKDKASNEATTSARCQALKDYFVEKGVGADRIEVKPNSSTDPKNPPPAEKMAKGKRYIGSVYYVVNQF